MADFTAQDVKKLRELTGVGMMECKQALVESDGDMDKAVEILRSKGLSAAAKKAGRIAAEGLVTTLHEGNSTVLVEVNAETDFVAKNQDFVQFVDNIAKTILKNKPATIGDLKALKLEGSEKTVEDEIRDKILVIGENISLRRFNVVEGLAAEYLHANGRIGVLVKFESAGDIANNEQFKTAARDVAMQIAAIAPQYIRAEDVPADVVDKERKFLEEQVVSEGKPAHIAEKIVEGRIGKLFEELCLMNQSFVKDGSMKVSEYIAQVGKEIGSDFTITEFIRYEVGEGMEKREEDFADEVASMIK